MQLAQGKSEAEIQQYFVERYGPRVLAEPPREGFNWIVWLLPIAGVIVGAILFGIYLNNLRKPSEDDEAMDVAQGAAPVPPPAVEENEYISRVEKEIRE
jgi:cytochrome c-type biogenesis protein CcmH